MRITFQTPVEVRQRLAEGKDAFPTATNLNEVAEESHRRFMARRWKGGSDAASAVIHWALSRLASHQDFSKSYWDWLTAPGMYGPNATYMRLLTILRPAMGLTGSWRHTETEVNERLEKIQSAIDTLVSAIRDSGGMSVSLRDVTGKFPEFQPLLDKLGEIEQAKRSEVFDARERARLAGTPMVWPRTAIQYVQDPSLLDYLLTLSSRLKGETVPRAQPNYRWDEEDSAADDEEEEPESEADRQATEAAMERVAEQFGLTPAQPRKPTVPIGGEFGAYPARQDALRRAVILAFPDALFEMTDEPPKHVTPAALIAEACIAWFGSAPQTKEINAAIRGKRADWERQKAERAKWHEAAKAIDTKLEGDFSETLRRFLDLD